MQQAGLSFGRGKVVRRGSLALPGAETRYLAERGEVSNRHSSGKRSIAALALIDCKSGGIWRPENSGTRH